MMYGWDTTNMMGAVGVWGILLWLVVFVDLVLLGIFLWKKIQKK